MAKPKNDDLVDAIIRSKMKGFRRAEVPKRQGATPESGTPDSAALRSKATSLTNDARLSSRAADILKKNLNPKGQATTDAAGSDANVPENDVVIAAAQPENQEQSDEPLPAKAVIVQKSKKKILLRQG